MGNRWRDAKEKNIKNIQIYINGKQVFIPKSAYDDLYEPTFYTENNSVYYDKEQDSYYIVATNSDGAGAYMVCWQIEKGIYKGKKNWYTFLEEILLNLAKK